MYGDKVVLFIPSNLAYGEQSWWRYTTKPLILKWKCSKKQVQNNKKSLLKLRLIKKPDILKIYRVSLLMKFFISYWSLNKMYCAISCYLSIENSQPWNFWTRRLKRLLTCFYLLLNFQSNSSFWLMIAPISTLLSHQTLFER
jgi:hypothetical protein